MALRSDLVDPAHDPEEPALLDASEVGELIDDDDDGDHPMDDDDGDGDGDDGGGDDEEIQLQNDSRAYFDAHADSIFCIAAHPTQPLYVTGGGDDLAYIWTPDGPEVERTTVPRAAKTVARLAGHTDSVCAAAFLGAGGGEYVVTAGLDGRVQLYSNAAAGGGEWKLVDAAQEVDEIVWLSPSPAARTTFALGANDGSVWVYDVADGALAIQHALYSHTAACTAGAWAAHGQLLATVAEDGSLYVWDVSSGRAVVALTAADQRFAVAGGLYSVAVSPAAAVAVVGGASGEMKVVGLPPPPAGEGTRKRTAQRPEARGGGQAGHILAALHAHAESVESLTFHPSAPILASGGVDGKIVLYDAAHGFAVRRTLDAHADAVVKVEFLDTGSAASVAEGWVLTSCGVDGTVRRWDARAGAQIGRWSGHLGGNQAEGEGGVLAFVQTRDRVVTAGDDGVALVFEIEGVAATGGVAAPTIQMR